MEKVKVKQVDGAVDVSNSQTITGEKTFLSPINIKSVGVEKGGQIIRIEGSWIYWVYDVARLNADGNFRLGKDPATGEFTLQVCKGGIWERTVL